MDTGTAVVPGSRIERIDERLAEIDERFAEIDAEQGEALIQGDLLTEWNALGKERKDLRELRKQMVARLRVIQDSGRAGGEDATEEVVSSFNVIKGKSEADIFDMASVRGKHNTYEGEVAHYVNNAKHAVEKANFPHSSRRREEHQAFLTEMLEGDEDGIIAKRILMTGSSQYSRAFSKQLMQWAGMPNAKPLTADEEGLLKRALTTGTGSTGGYAVPFTLDPTLIHTSNYSVNPWRAICRNVVITTNQWKAVTSGSVAATRSTEAGTASDASPTLTQPSVTPQRVQAAFPFSVEIEGDWPALQAEIGLLLSEAKDEEEANSFYNGSGTAPAAVGILGFQGLTTSQRQQTAGTAAFVIGDVYALQNALTARIRPRATYVAGNYVWGKVRQFDTAGGAGLFAQNLTVGLGVGAGTDAQLNIPLLGRPAYELSPLNPSNLNSGTKLILAGDFSRFVIVDRVGMQLEYIPQIFGTTGMPTGQRAIYAWWRNGTCLADANAFRYLETL